MNKLLRANFARLWKSKAFIISNAVMFFMGLGFVVLYYLENVYVDGGWNLDDGFFAFALLVFVLASVFTSLFIGTEYGDGTIRNKIIMGHKRTAIYLSNLIVCATASLIMCVVYMIPQLCVGIPMLGFFESSMRAVVFTLLAVFAMTLALVALFTLIAMLCQNKSSSAIACVLFAFALLFIGVRIIAGLHEPEYYSTYSYTENGKMVAEDETPNPNYVSGTKREIYEFLKEFIAGGQVIELINMTADRPDRLALYDLIILVVTTGCGMIIFKKKDLR